MRPVKKKKKMKKGSERAERVKRLRAALGMTQVEFGAIIRVDPSIVSKWEAGKLIPTAEAYVALGNLAPYPENLSFWKQAGLDRNAMVSSAGAILEERARPGKDIETVRVPLLRQTSRGLEPAGPLVSLPSGFLDNAASTKCLVTRQNIDLGVRRTVIVLDQSKTDLHSLWEEVVLVDFKSHAAEWMKTRSLLPKPPEQVIGLLRKEFEYDTEGLSWSAEIWSEHGSPLLHTLTIARCHFPFLPKIRRDKAGFPQPREMLRLQQKSGHELATDLKLMDGIRILGRVVGWFRLPREER